MSKDLMLQKEFWVMIVFNNTKLIFRLSKEPFSGSLQNLLVHYKKLMINNLLERPPFLFIIQQK